MKALTAEEAAKKQDDFLLDVTGIYRQEDIVKRDEAKREREKLQEKEVLELRQEFDKKFKAAVNGALKKIAPLAVRSGQWNATILTTPDQGGALIYRAYLSPKNFPPGGPTELDPLSYNRVWYPDGSGPNSGWFLPKDRKTTLAWFQARSRDATTVPWSKLTDIMVQRWSGVIAVMEKAWETAPTPEQLRVDDILRQMDKICKRFGYQQNKAESEGPKTLVASFRSDVLPKEGAYEMGHDRYDDLVAEVLGKVSKFAETALAPYKEWIDSVDFQDEEKSWVYITVTLK